MIWCFRFCRNTNYFVPNGMYVSDLIDYASICLKIIPGDILIATGSDDMYHVSFTGIF